MPRQPMFDTMQGTSVTAITAAADLLDALLDCDPAALAGMSAADRNAREHARRWLDSIDRRDGPNIWPYEVPPRGAT